MTKHVSITTHPDGTGNILVQGMDISNSVSGIRVSLRPGDLPRVELDICAMGLEYSGDAQVVIEPATAETLVALGWTPPATAA